MAFDEKKLKAAAQSIVRQWDEHDRFRVCEGESSDDPAEVAVARAYLALEERQPDTFAIREADGELFGRFRSAERCKAVFDYPTQSESIVRVVTFISPVGEKGTSNG